MAWRGVPWSKPCNGAVMEQESKVALRQKSRGQGGNGDEAASTVKRGLVGWRGGAERGGAGAGRHSRLRGAAECGTGAPEPQGLPGLPEEL